MRTYQIRPLTAVALCAVLLFSTTAFKCGDGSKTPEQEKAEFTAYAKDIRASVVAASPLILQLKPQLADRWNRAVSISGEMISAVEHSDKTTAAALVVELVPIFTAVIDEFTDNQKVLIALALGNIALQFFANHYLNEVTDTAPSRSAAAGNVKRAKVAAFASRKKWRCRNSINGQFAAMEYCVGHPETSQVITQ